MNKKMVTIILAIALLAGFFLPYVSFLGQGASGFDMVKSEGAADKYILVLVPLAAILLVLGAVNNGKYILSRGILAILGLVGVLYLIVNYMINGGDIGAIIKILGLGYWISLVAALGLVLYNPKD